MKKGKRSHAQLIIYLLRLITFINIKIYANLGGAREGRKTISTGGEEGQAETDISAADLPSRPGHAPVGWAGAPVMRGVASRITVLPLEQPLLNTGSRPLFLSLQPGSQAQTLPRGHPPVSHLRLRSSPVQFTQ
jgi:hypothetical protein